MTHGAMEVIYDGKRYPSRRAFSRYAATLMDTRWTIAQTVLYRHNWNIRMALAELAGSPGGPRKRMLYPRPSLPPLVEIVVAEPEPAPQAAPNPRELPRPQRRALRTTITQRVRQYLIEDQDLDLKGIVARLKAEDLDGLIQRSTISTLRYDTVCTLTLARQVGWGPLDAPAEAAWPTRQEYLTQVVQEYSEREVEHMAEQVEPVVADTVEQVHLRVKALRDGTDFWVDYLAEPPVAPPLVDDDKIKQIREGLGLVKDGLKLVVDILGDLAKVLGDE